MTIQDLPQTSTKENKIKAIELLIKQIEEQLLEAINKEQFDLANQKDGLLKGLEEGRTYLTTKHFLDIGDALSYAERNLQKSMNNKDWGKSSYWDSYLSGLGLCKVIIENGE